MISIGQRFRTLARLLDTFWNSKRMFYKIFGYNTEVTFADMLHKYGRQDIAGRIVDAEPRATWSQQPVPVLDDESADQEDDPTQSLDNDPDTADEGIEDDDADDNAGSGTTGDNGSDSGGNDASSRIVIRTRIDDPMKDFRIAWKRLARKTHLFQALHTLDKLIGMDVYAVLIIGLDDGLSLDTPVNTNRDNKVIYLQPYTASNCKILQYDENPTSPRYGKPALYQLNPGTNDAERNAAGASGISMVFKPQTTEVHHSRVLHVVEYGIEGKIFGIPRMKRVFNLLDDLLKTVGGAAESFWINANRGMQVNVDKDMDLQPDAAMALDEEIEDFYENMTRVLRTKGVEVNTLDSTTPNPRNTFDVIISLISGTSGIPRRILMGSEQGQLASQQDRANWATRIQERRTLFVEPEILRPLVVMFIDMNVLPKPPTVEGVEAPDNAEEMGGMDDLVWRWPDAFIMNPLERAMTSAQRARSLANVAKALSDDQAPCSIDEGREMIGLDGPFVVERITSPDDTSEGTAPGEGTQTSTDA